MGLKAVSVFKEDYGHGAIGIPTAICQRADGRLIFGKKARELLFCDQEKGLDNFFAKISEYPERIIQHSTYRGYFNKYTAEELTERYLSFVLKETTRKAEKRKLSVNCAIEEITASIPVSLYEEGMLNQNSILFKNLLIRVLKRISNLSEDKIHIVEESKAAVNYYINKKGIEQKGAYLIFYLDYMSFRAYVVETDPNSPNRISTCTSATMHDIDIRNWSYNIERLNCKNKEENKTVKLGTSYSINKPERWMLDDAFVLSEKQLRMYNSCKVADEKDYLGREAIRQIVGLERGISPYIDLIVRFADWTLRMYENIRGYKEREGIKHIDKILLVGGASKLPKVREEIFLEYRGRISEEKIEFLGTSVAISYGACQKYIDSEMSIMKGKREMKNQLKHSYGIRAVVNDEAVIKNILIKGTEFAKDSITESISLWPNHDAQKSVIFNIYRSDEAREIVELKDNTPFISFKFDVEKEKGETKDDCEFYLSLKYDKEENIRIRVDNHKGKTVYDTKLKAQ